jgi:hypothetical protein
MIAWWRCLLRLGPRIPSKVISARVVKRFMGRYREPYVARSYLLTGAFGIILTET